MLKSKTDIQRYGSVLSYSVLTKLLARKFFLDKNLCMVNLSEANKLIGTVLTSIERDINAIEQHFNQHEG